MEISIHVLREEDDPWKTDFDKMAMNFYPRPPRGGRLRSAQLEAHKIVFLSTSSARRTTPKLCKTKVSG